MTTYDTALTGNSLDAGREPPAPEELLARAGRGDEQAFELLYDEYSSPIYNYVLRLVHRESIAEELLQEVFLAAWKGARRFRGESKVKTWLFRIAHHTAVSWLRREREVFSSDGELPDRPVPDRSEAKAMHTWRTDQLRIALDRLTPEHRAVLELAFFHELPYAEIATILDCPVGTVKSRMSYARRYLSQFLREQGVEEP